MLPADDLEFRVLGPVEVRSGSRTLALGGPKQRALLAILILSAGRAVSTTQLIDDLWGTHPPATAAHTVEAYISRIRRLLRAEVSGDLLLTQPPGYLLRVDPDRVDAVRFQRRVAEGEAALDRGDAELAAQLLGSALALWRGLHWQMLGSHRLPEVPPGVWRISGWPLWRSGSRPSSRWAGTESWSPNWKP